MRNAPKILARDQSVLHVKGDSKSAENSDKKSDAKKSVSWSDSKTSDESYRIPRLVTYKDNKKFMYGVPKQEFDAMTFEEKNMCCTKWVFDNKIHTKLPQHFDSRKGTCRWLIKQDDGRYEPHLHQHGANGHGNCPEKESHHVDARSSHFDTT